MESTHHAPLAAPRHSGHVAACALRVAPGERLQRLIPAGEFTAPRGALAGAGPWRLTPAAAGRLIAANRSRSADIAVDYEHQLLLSENNGLPAPASGWIDPRSLEYRDQGEEPGLYGAVSWTARAAQMIADGEYRYLSPVFTFDPDTGEPLDLLHVGLVNFPAIDEPLMAALSARYSGTDPNPRGNAPASTQETPPVNELLKKLLAALGLPDGTSEESALTGVAALKAKADGADAKVTAAQAEVAALKAAGPGTPDLAKFVPIEAVQGMQVQLAALSATVHAGQADQIIDKAIAEGKLVEAQRSWANDLGKKDLAALKAYVEATPAIAALKGMQTQGREMGGGGGNGLSEADLAVCKALGMTPDEFKKGKVG